MNPPLRTADDVAACIDGIKDGTIDCLATDHAPHRAEEKELEFPDAPFGIIGLECALALYIKALIEPGHIDWMKLIELMSTRPAQIVKFPRGTLADGAVADVTVIDPDRRVDDRRRQIPRQEPKLPVQRLGSKRTSAGHDRRRRNQMDGQMIPLRGRSCAALQQKCHFTHNTDSTPAPKSNCN